MRISFLFCFLFSLISSAHTQNIVQTILLPDTPFWNQAWGLTAFNGSLYVGSATSDPIEGRKIMKLNFDGQVIDSIIMPPGIVNNQGLSFSGAGQMFFIRRYASSCTIMRFTTTGNFLDSIHTNQLIGGCMGSANLLWYSVYEPDANASLCLRSFPSGQQWVTFQTPSLQPHGVASDGAYLYYVENGSQGNSRGIYKLNQSSGDSVGFIPEPQDNTSNGTNPIGLSYDGRYMWLLAEPVGANSGRALYKYDLQSGGIPIINLVPSEIDFGAVRIGQNKKDKLEVQNLGDATLHVFGITSFIGQFGTDSINGFSVPPQSSVLIPISYYPYQYGFDYGDFYFSTDDPNNLDVLWFAYGFGVYSSPFISTLGSYNFGAQPIGSSTSWSMKISNLGADSLLVSSISSNDPAFGIDSVQFPIRLDSLQTDSVQVWFRPVLGIPYSGVLTITSTASNGVTRNIQLTGSTWVPIQMSSFSATPLPNGHVRLNWRTISETNNYGFEVQRKASDGEFVTLPNSFVPGHGTTLEPHSYSFTDNTVTIGHWRYRLKQIDLDGTFTFTEEVMVNVVTGIVENPIPTIFAIRQSYPNPFNPSTTIKYDLPEPAKVSLIIYDVLGRKVAELVNEDKAAGYHSITWNAADVASGVYLARFMASDANGYSKYSSVNKLVLMK